MSEWISVKDRLPELIPDSHMKGDTWFDSGRVLVYDASDKTIACGNLYRHRDMNSRWSVQEWDDWSYVDVTHWMPLPEPPK